MHSFKKLPLHVQLAVAHMFVRDPTARVVTVGREDVIFGELTYADLLPSLREAENAGIINVDVSAPDSLRIEVVAK